MQEIFGYVVQTWTRKKNDFTLGLVTDKKYQFMLELKQMFKSFKFKFGNLKKQRNFSNKNAVIN